MIELVYGSESADADALARSLGRTLGISFECRDSAYKGTYWLAKSADGRIKVIANALADYDDQPEQNKEYSWQFEDNKECLTLLWFDIKDDAGERIKVQMEDSKLSVKLLRETKY